MRSFRHENIDQSWAKNSLSFSTPKIVNVLSGIFIDTKTIQKKKQKMEALNGIRHLDPEPNLV